MLDRLLIHLDILRQDLRYARRTLTRAPGFALTAIVVIALGIGATTAAYSVTDFVLIRPLPFAEPERLVKLYERTPGYRMELSAPNYRDWTAAATVFERIGMYHLQTVNLVGAGSPLNVNGAVVTADLFPTLGVPPLIGRPFAEGDDREGAPGVTLLGYGFWQSQFGGDPTVIGRRVLLDNEPHTVVGVMPPAFRFPSSEAMLWTAMRSGEQNGTDRNDNWLYAVGRLRRGVTFEQASAELDVIAARSRAQYPKENANVGAVLVRLRDELSPQARYLLYALCGAAGCVLLIAAANLANLLLARALGRRRELAVRTAIGAGRERMARQLLTESLVLATLGGALGVLVAYAAVPLLNRLVPQTLPLATAPSVDVRVLAFAIVLTVATGIAFGLAPVVRIGGEADLRGLREGSRGGGGQKERLRSALVVAEIVASIVLLVSAGLLMRALWNVQSIDPGLKPEGVLALRTALPVPEYATLSKREAFYTRVLSEVRALPGVTRAAYVSYQPLGRMRGGIWPVAVDGQPLVRADNQVAFLRYVTPGYFTTMGITMKSGRDIEDGDTRERRPYAAVVSESFVKRYWPKEDVSSVLGRRFTFALDDRIVVGVAGDVRMRGLERQAEPQVYLSYKQVADNSIIGYIPRSLAVRTTAEPTSLVAPIRAIIARVDPMLPVSDVNTMTQVVEDDTASRTTQLRVIGAFAVIAFVLAAVGIHGLLSFAVSQRAQEIGVRMALGAQRRDILAMVVGRSARLALAGVVPGVALAYAAGRWMQSLLVGVTPADAPTFLAAAALAVVMTLAGTLLPTLRALRVDPISSLRAE
jgi:predicted permease